MSKPAPETKPKEFQLVNPKETVQLLSESARTLASVLMWTKNRDFTLNSHVGQFNQIDKSLLISMPKESSLESFIESLTKLKTKECLFCVSHFRANLFFTANFNHPDHAGLCFDTPEMLHKVQRRANMRYQIPIEQGMRVEFQDPLSQKATLWKKVIDISASGMSFLTSETDDPIYKKGLILEKVTFVIKTQKIVTSAEVHYQKPLPSSSFESGIKVGVAFRNIDEATSQLITTYVNDETRKYYMALL